ncbi:unnamed protein product [Paramecium pentaurelia]|uniref:WD40-repeat-containing domain n=1 Tax=Paramecium pentaurelia TaxID=43138 RepID=A0A8S1YGK9_9CILI|nr:unnamed protein product [Paramecium pentaurelia]
MIQQKMLEQEEDLFCSQKHNLPVLMIACDKELKKNQRLFCPLCMENLESKSKSMSFKKTLENIEENQKQKKESIENMLIINIKQLEELQRAFHQLKSNIVQQLDYLIGNTNEWIKQIQIWGQSNVTYSFFDELEKLINQTKLDQTNQKSIVDQINQINQSWNQKIFKKLNLFKSFQEIQKCEELLIRQLIKGNQENDNKKQKEVIQVDIQQNQQKQQLIINKQVELKLIDDSNQQSNYCQAIVFDKTGSIMISCEVKKIKIWNFELGKLKLINTYSKHKDNVTCLVYSKLRNNFISGSDDKTIISWQQINQKEWKCSQPFQQHNDYINCLMLNKQEDQLISGGYDNSIKVWNVDFIKNELNFQYSLDHHRNIVFSFCFNSSETVLVSCGYSEFIIWEKGVQGKWEFKYKQDVLDYGYKLHLINDQQFLWVTNSMKIDDIFVFEIQNGVVQQNIDKTIKLIQNNQCDDNLNFPIIHNKNKNIILVRHKHHIYLISKLNDGTFNIIASLNCQNNEIYGTMTNNGQYLLFWDNKYEKYQSYEILYK